MIKNPANACQTPATIHMGLMEMQLKMPKKIAAERMNYKNGQLELS